MRGALKGAFIMLLICVGFAAVVVLVAAGMRLIQAGYAWAAWGGLVMFLMLIGACIGYKRPTTPER